MSEQPKPDSKKYTDLISGIEKGQIKVPKFQRDFVWSLDKTAKLLDSILKGYPIGTFILWKTSERMNDIKNIGNLELQPAPEDEKIEYVLDGQQRMTSLYAAYKGAEIQKVGEKKITDYSKIYVDLEKDVDNDEQIVVQEEPEDTVFITLNEVLNFNDNLLAIQEKYTNEQFKKIHKYSQTFSTYDFSTIVLRREDISSAIEVFTRINTGGQILTLFEIMSAKTYDEEQNFDMEEKYQNLLIELRDSHYDTVSSSVILNILGLILSPNNECKRKVILELNKEEIINTWDDVTGALKDSIDYFRSAYRIPVSSLLPYDSLLVPFAYFFYKKRSMPNEKQRQYLEEFFWRMSLSYRYSSSTESKLAQDIKRIDEILNGGRPNYDEIIVNLNSSDDLIKTNFSAGNSYSKAILCLLAYNQPEDFKGNGKVILDNSWLKAANSKNFHHFFPKAYLKKQGILNENSLMNITLVGADLNKRQIGAKEPSRYVNDFQTENTNLKDSLLTHFIDIDNDGIYSDDYSLFLNNRAERIYKEIEKRLNLGGGVSNVNSGELDILKLSKQPESHILEFKSTLSWNIRAGIKDKKMEDSVLKTIAAFNNSDGGILLIGIDDDNNVLGLEDDFEKAGLKDDDKFELHLKNILEARLSLPTEYIARKIKISFTEIEGKYICSVEVEKGSKPAFVEDVKFYIRHGNSTDLLPAIEVHTYIKEKNLE